MNFPHHCHSEIFHTRDDELPGHIQFFAAAVDLIHYALRSLTTVRLHPTHLETRWN